MNMKKKFKVEKSAGGLVTALRSGTTKILMVEVKNLSREVVWTFPKGHLEKNETNEQAALREVEEETGWLCKITPDGNQNIFKKVLYWFNRGENLVRKEVVWFLMSPIRKTGGRDPDEIRKVKWIGLGEVKKKVKYPSDRKLLKKLESQLG